MSASKADDLKNKLRNRQTVQEKAIPIFEEENPVPGPISLNESEEKDININTDIDMNNDININTDPEDEFDPLELLEEKEKKRIGVHVYLRPETKKLIDQVAGGKKKNTKGNRSEFVDAVLEQYFRKKGMWTE